MSTHRPILAIYKDVLRSGRGADRVTAALANALAKRGYCVHLLTQQPKGEALSVTLDSTVTLHRVQIPKPSATLRFLNKLLLKSAGGARLLRSLPALDLTQRVSLKLQATLREIHPDLILSSGPNEAVDLTYAGPLPAPLLQLFHTYPPSAFASNKRRRADRLREALRHVAACQVLLPDFVPLLRPYTEAPCTAIGNAIDWPTDEPLPAPESRDKTILYVAYFSKDKDHLTLLEAFAKLQRAQEWCLVLYGAGTPEWERRLRQRAQDLGIADRVDFPGLLDNPRPTLLRAGICAYPSRVEGFGLALAEAMWCGLPCVGFADAPGVNGLIEDERTGLLATPGPEAFAAQLQRLIDDPGLRTRLGNAASDHIRKAYAAPVIWEQWDAFLRSLL